jgi:hypothetical protein
MTHKVHPFHLWYVYLAKWNILWAKSDDIYIYTCNCKSTSAIYYSGTRGRPFHCNNMGNFHIVQLVLQRCTVLLSNNFLAGSAFLPKRVDHEFHCINIKTEFISCRSWSLPRTDRLVPCRLPFRSTLILLISDVQWYHTPMISHTDAIN